METTSELIMIISRADLLLEFMDAFNLWRLMDATEDQLRDFITKHNLAE